MSRLSAEDTYRELFRLWRDCNELQRPILEMAMDKVQCEIADGPRDPRWLAFVITMPDAFPPVHSMLMKRWRTS